MKLVIQLFTVSALTSLICLLPLSLWAALFAWRKQFIARDCELALISVHLTLGAQIALLGPLWIAGHLREPLTTLAYAVTALAAVPSIWAYLPHENPRQHSSSISLACLFAMGMVVRVLQTATGDPT